MLKCIFQCFGKPAEPADDLERESKLGPLGPKS